MGSGAWQPVRTDLLATPPMRRDGRARLKTPRSGRPTMPKVEVTEYPDAVCSTAWGAEPLLRRLDWRHGHHIAWRKVMGGLVGDASTGKAAWDRVSAAEPMRAYWKRVWHLTGMPYPNPMRLMLRSTDPLGAAVKAAELQGQAVADAVL